MRLIITRHGETVENKQGIVQGQLIPGELTKLGIEQARRLAARLKDEKIDVIYSSDLARAAETTKIIAKLHPGVPIEFVKALREMNFGEFQGKKIADINWDIILKEYISDTNKSPGKGESLSDVYSRANKFINNVTRMHRNKTVLLSCHNEIKKAVICAITGKTPSDIFRMKTFGKTSVSIFEINEDKSHKIHCLNCTKHLKPQTLNTF
jgi:broad specificity phosphatase PhoE